MKTKKHIKQFLSATEFYKDSDAFDKAGFKKGNVLKRPKKLAKKTRDAKLPWPNIMNGDDLLFHVEGSLKNEFLRGFNLYKLDINLKAVLRLLKQWNPYDQLSSDNLAAIFHKVYIDVTRIYKSSNELFRVFKNSKDLVKDISSYKKLISDFRFFLEDYSKIVIKVSKIESDLNNLINGDVSMANKNMVLELQNSITRLSYQLKALDLDKTFSILKKDMENVF